MSPSNYPAMQLSQSRLRRYQISTQKTLNREGYSWQKIRLFILN